MERGPWNIPWQSQRATLGRHHRDAAEEMSRNAFSPRAAAWRLGVHDCLGAEIYMRKRR